MATGWLPDVSDYSCLEKSLMSVIDLVFLLKQEVFNRSHNFIRVVYVRVREIQANSYEPFSRAQRLEMVLSWCYPNLVKVCPAFGKPSHDSTIGSPLARPEDMCGPPRKFLE